MKKWINDFKAFVLRGNVVDMAVGIIIGGAFTAIVTSLVKDIFNPLFALLSTNSNLSSMKLVLREASEGVEAVSLNYGNLLSTILNFFIIAFVLFLLIKLTMKLVDSAKKLKKEEEAKVEAEQPKTPTDNELLQAILAELQKK